MSVSKMLCLHIPSLIPQHFSTIDVASTVQAAAVAGAGLLYEGSCHRMMTEFLLNEIGKRPSSDGNVLDREAYSLACGISLGMVNLCQGGNDPAGTGAGLADLGIEERLYRYVVGGTDDAELRRRRDESDRLSLQSSSGSGNNERCSCVYEGENINTDVTAPGATLALGLIFMKSGNESIASAIALPDTHFLLEYVRPDFLMLRVIARALIMWDRVQPTDDWVEQQMPSAISKAYAEMVNLAELLNRGLADAEDHDKDYDRQAVRLIYVHVLAGACFALGLRFAGTGNKDAASVIFGRLQELCDLRGGHDAVHAALRPPTPVLEMCLGCVAISLSMVLAGTGDLNALRILKILRWPCGEEISYGSHLAYGMAIGLLCLGGGKSTLGREPSDIAALLMALYPRFPSSTSDNQYHLQAMRNLYALAVRHREVKAVDVDTGKCVFVPVEMHFEKQALEPMCKTAPFLLLNTDVPIRQLRVVSDQYYSLSISFADGLDKTTLFVKRKNQYQDKYGPSSSRIVFDGMGNMGGKDALDFLSHENTQIFAFGKHICDLGQPGTAVNTATVPFSLPSFCLRALFQCLQHDSLEALPIYLTLRNAIDLMEKDSRWKSSFEWDLRLLRSYYQRWCVDKNETYSPLLSTEIVAYLIELTEQALVRSDRNDEVIESSYFGVSRKIVTERVGVSDDMDLN
jgi:anaphase-promoting complex subunit 1